MKCWVSWQLLPKNLRLKPRNLGDLLLTQKNDNREKWCKAINPHRLVFITSCWIVLSAAFGNSQFPSGKIQIVTFFQVVRAILNGCCCFFIKLLQQKFFSIEKVLRKEDFLFKYRSCFFSLTCFGAKRVVFVFQSRFDISM